MKKIFDIKPVKVCSVTCSAVVSLVAVGKYIYVLTTHSGDNKKKQPCVLHRYDTESGKYVTKVIKTSNGSTNIAVHANSLTYNDCDGLFYMVTRNGAGPKYNQILAFDKNGAIKKKFKYQHDKSKIATINWVDEIGWLITVNGGSPVKMRRVAKLATGDCFMDTGFEKLLCFNHTSLENTIGNDTFITNNGIVYATKTSVTDYCKNYICEFDLCDHAKKLTILYAGLSKLIPPKGYTKFEVEGVCLDKSGRQYIAVNGVKNGKQADGVWEL